MRQMGSGTYLVLSHSHSGPGAGDCTRWGMEGDRKEPLLFHKGGTSKDLQKLCLTKLLASPAEPSPKMPQPLPTVGQQPDLGTEKERIVPIR